MCGFAGIYSFSRDAGMPRAEDVARMRDTLRHRGPDDEGLYLAPGVGLGFRRLSIIDLEGGHQPIANEDESVWLAYNGEVYNFKELREELIRAGHTFRTNSDSEVIVHLYEERGLECVDALRGMFAFALYDKRRHRLLLARDRVGIKPLYYRVEPDRVLFGSEPRAILAHMRPADVEIDPDVVAMYFSMLYVPDDSTAYKGVQRLSPGHRLVVDGPEPREQRYWQAGMPTETAEGTDLREITARIRSRIEESVRLRMVSDVPLGAFLSGGLDSSTVVGCMAGMTDSPVKTFTVSFAEAPYDESEPARATANRWNTEHHELRLDPDSWKTVETLADVYDEPFGDPSAIPTYLVSRFARESVTVALSGDGGDELFAGYHRYRHLKQLEQMRRIPRFARSIAARVASGHRLGRAMSRSLLPFPDDYFDGENFLVPELATILRGDTDADLPAQGRALYRAHARSGDAVAAAQIIDLETYLPGDILTKVDRASIMF